MANLIGLSPEEINTIRNTDVNEQNLLLNAANALGKLRSDQAQTAAYINANQPDLVGVKYEGIDYKIRRQDLPSFLEVARKAGKDKDVVTFNLPGGGNVDVLRQDVPAMMNSIFTGQRVGPQNAADLAAAGLRGAQAEEIQTKIPYIPAQMEQGIFKDYAAGRKSVMDSNKTELELPYVESQAQQKAQQDYQLGRKYGSEADANIAKLDAAKALGGATPQTLFEGNNLGNAIIAVPSTIPALANKYQTDSGLSNNELRQYEIELGALNRDFVADPEKVTNAQVEAYNALAGKAGLNNAWIKTDDEAIQVTLPITVSEAKAKMKKQNITFKDIADEAKKRKMDVQEFIPYVFKALEE